MHPQQICGKLCKAVDKPRGCAALHRDLDRTVEHVARRDCGVSVLGDIKNVSNIYIKDISRCTLQNQQCYESNIFYSNKK